MVSRSDKGKAPNKPNTKKPAKKQAPKESDPMAPKNFDKYAITLFEAIEYGTQQVDHGAVARAVGIQKPAARMRHIRAMRAVRAFRDSLSSTLVPNPSPALTPAQTGACTGGNVTGPSNVNQGEQRNQGASTNEATLGKANGRDNSCKESTQAANGAEDDEDHPDNSTDVDIHSASPVHETYADSVYNALVHGANRVADADLEDDRNDGSSLDIQSASPENEADAPAKNTEA